MDIKIEKPEEKSPLQLRDAIERDMLERILRAPTAEMLVQTTTAYKLWREAETPELFRHCCYYEEKARKALIHARDGHGEP